MAGDGELAQLVERCDRTAEVRGSSPLFSIIFNLGGIILHTDSDRRAPAFQGGADQAVVQGSLGAVGQPIKAAEKFSTASRFRSGAALFFTPCNRDRPSAFLC